MIGQSERAESFLPLTEATFYILISLSSPLHGYGVIQAVERMSKGRVVIGPGTLYGAFQRLVKQKLIRKIDMPGSDDDRRKLYQLTDLGAKVVTAELNRLREMVDYGEKALERYGGDVDGSHE